MVIGYSGGKECCSNVSSHLWEGALRDDTKNGSEGDYAWYYNRTKLIGGESNGWELHLDDFPPTQA